MTYDIYLTYHHEDQEYANLFLEKFGEFTNLLSSKIDRIEDESSDEYIERFIEESNISKDTIVVVLAGPKTYKRKHVDWDIMAGLMQKSALLGLCLPMRNDYNLDNFIYQTYPHRLQDNVKTGYSLVHKWTLDEEKIDNILAGSLRRSQNKILIRNTRKSMSKDYHFCGATGCECH